MQCTYTFPAQTPCVVKFKVWLGLSDSTEKNQFWREKKNLEFFINLVENDFLNVVCVLEYGPLKSNESAQTGIFLYFLYWPVKDPLKTGWCVLPEENKISPDMSKRILKGF